MPAKPNSRNWNDVQTAIATVAIVATLGMWNLFATPAKAEGGQVEEPIAPPTEPPAPAEPTPMPQVKIMFAEAAPQTVTSQQPETTKKKKKKNNNNNNAGGNSGGGSVTQTKTS